MRAPAVPVPDVARESVDAIVAQRAAWQIATRNLRVAMEAHAATGADADALFSQAKAIDAAEDALRKKHFPRVARVTVDPWGVYIFTPSGRGDRMVWKREPTRTETPLIRYLSRDCEEADHGYCEGVARDGLPCQCQLCKHPDGRTQH